MNPHRQSILSPTKKLAQEYLILKNNIPNSLNLKESFELMNNDILNINNKEAYIKVETLLKSAEEKYINNCFSDCLNILNSSLLQNNYNALYLKGQVYLNKYSPYQNYYKALDIFLNLNQETEHKVSLKHILGVIYYNLKDYESSIPYLREGNILDPSNQEIKYCLILSIIQNNNIPEAKLEIEDAIKTDTKNINILLLASYLEFNNKNLERVFFYLNKAYSLDENNFLVLLNLSLLYLKQNNFQSASRWAKKAFLIDGNNLKLLKIYMIICFKLEEYDELEGICIKVLSIEKYNSNAISCLHFSLENLGKFEELNEFYESLLKKLREKNDYFDQIIYKRLENKIKLKLEKLKNEKEIRKTSPIRKKSNESKKTSNINKINKFMKKMKSTYLSNNDVNEQIFNTQSSIEEIKRIVNANAQESNYLNELYVNGCVKLKENLYWEAYNIFISIYEMDNTYMTDIIYESLGDCLFKQRDYMKAIDYFNQSLEINKKPILYVKLGRCYENINNFDKAIDLYNKSISYNENSVWGNFHLGCLIINNIEKQVRNMSLSQDNNLIEEKKDNSFYISETNNLKFGNNENETRSIQQSVNQCNSTNYIQMNSILKYKSKEISNNEEYLLNDNDPFIIERNKGLKHIEKAWNFSKNEKGIYTRYIIELVKSKQYKDAIALFQESSKLFPGAIDSIISVSKAYEKLNRINESISILEKACQFEEFNEDPERLFILGYTYDKAKNFSKAIKTYKNVLLINSNHLSSLINLSKIYINIKEEVKAMKYVKYIIKTYPKTVYAYYLLAKIYYNLNNYEQSLLNIDIIIELDSSFSQAYSLKGRILLNMDQTFEATSAFEMALKYNKEDYQSYIGLGNIYFEMSEINKAKMMHEKAYLIEKNNIKTVLPYVKTLFTLKEFNQAESILKLILSKQENSIPEIHFYYGNILFLKKDWNSAVKQYKLSKFNEDIKEKNREKLFYLYQNLGASYFQLKKFKDSIKSYKKALSYNQSSNEIFFNLANSLFMNSEYFESKRFFEKCILNGFNLKDCYLGVLRCIAESKDCEAIEYSNKIIDYYIKEVIGKEEENNQKVLMNEVNKLKKRIENLSK